MSKRNSLAQLLRMHEISVEQFFSVPGIASQIKHQLTKFVNYCKKHKVFTMKMVSLGLDVTYQDLESEPVRSASHAINEVFANEQASLAELFFDQESQESEETSEHIEELPECSIQNEAERLFEDEPEMPQTERQIEVGKYEVVRHTLSILAKDDKNETCLGHIYKLFAFLVRNNSGQVLQFFQQDQQAKQLLISNLRYCSVSSIVGQLLTCEDKTKVYRYESLKRKILEQIIEIMLDNSKDNGLFDGLMSLIEEVFNSTKQSYYEYFEDFKRIANLLVNNKTLSRFYNIICQLSEPSFRNASKYLEAVMVRVNGEREESSSYNKQSNEPTMDFEMNVLFNNVATLVAIIPQIGHFDILCKLSYLSFLTGLFESSWIDYSNLKLEDILPPLLATLGSQNKSGIYATKLYHLAALVVDRSSTDALSAYLDMAKNIYQTNFKSLKGTNSTSLKIHNRNEFSAFDMSLLIKMNSKNSRVFKEAQPFMGRDLTRLQKKYSTKIASFCQNSSSAGRQDDSNSFKFYQLNLEEETEDTGKMESVNGSLFNGLSLNLVGKNHVSIPVLHLPNKNFDSAPMESRDKDSEQEKIQVKEVLQFEQVQQINLDDMRERIQEARQRLEDERKEAQSREERERKEREESAKQQKETMQKRERAETAHKQREEQQSKKEQSKQQQSNEAFESKKAGKEIRQDVSNESLPKVVEQKERIRQQDIVFAMASPHRPIPSHRVEEKQIEFLLRHALLYA